MARTVGAICGFVCLVFAASCARPVDDSLPFAEHFQSASALHAVPSDILTGIAASESAFVMQRPDGADFHPVDIEQPSAADLVAPNPVAGDADEGHVHHAPYFGLMGFRDEEQMVEGARLIGRTLDEVKAVPAANIEAAAALLAKYKRDAEKGGWEEAVRRFGARGSAAAGEVFVREVARYAPVELMSVVQRAAQEARPDSARARWVGTNNYRAASRQRGQVDKIIIHTVQGSYSGAIGWMQNPRSQVSSHYVIRSRDGEITQMVEENDVAWHVSCWNNRSIGIEHEGYAEHPGTWYTEAMYQSSARLVAEIAQRWGIPIDRNHIQGHIDATRQSGCNDHWDPGPGWNWDHYMALVRRYAGQGGTPGGNPQPSPSTGRLRGAIYDGARDMNASGNRLSGATVRLSNGLSVTTGSDGMYLFNVAPGNYTVTASKGGWSTVSVSRAVTANADAWGSIGLRAQAPAGATGKYVGVVYDAARSPQDRAGRLAGATVRLSNGATTTTDSAGYFQFRVAPGSYTATATKSGYNAGSSTRTVAANAEIWGSVALRR